MLKKMSKIEFKIKLLTGLHIGCSNDEFDIGGADSNVIKNPLTHEPYIPGSSLKGKAVAVPHTATRLPKKNAPCLLNS